MLLSKMICKFKDRCKYFQPESITCKHNGGEYYGSSRHSGCYRDLEEIEVLKDAIRNIYRKNTLTDKDFQTVNKFVKRIKELQQ